MQSNVAKKVSAKNAEHLIWEIEISDLGNSKPFLGFSLTGQYLLVSLTSPDQENKVDIQSIPEQQDQPLIIPIRLNAIDFPQKGRLHFKGIRRLLENWQLTLIERQSGFSFALRNDAIFSLAKIQQAAFDSNLGASFQEKVVLELQLSPKK